MCKHSIVNDNFFKDLNLKLGDIMEIFKMPFFRDRETVHCLKCGKNYWQRKPIKNFS